MESAYGKATYEAAKAALKPGLKLMNQSALHSLEEGLEETLTLHRLGLTPMLKNSFRTTNCIENVNSLLKQLTHNVRRWTNFTASPLGSPRHCSTSNHVCAGSRAIATCRCSGKHYKPSSESNSSR